MSDVLLTGSVLGDSGLANFEEGLCMDDVRIAGRRSIECG